MSVMVLRIDVILIGSDTPPCRSRSPLDELTERLRAEMRHGRDYRPTTCPGVAVGVVAALGECTERN